jgi:hypothetical protein
VFEWIAAQQHERDAAVRTHRHLEPSPATLARVDYPNTDAAVRRAGGLARNLKLVLRRTGLGGFAALVADRATPNVLAFRRTFVQRADCGGEPHPELAPRRLRSLEPEVTRLFAEVARTREPDIQPLDESDLRERFDRGEELWLFHTGGHVGHLRWIGRGPLMLTGFTLPLRRDERVGEDVITVPQARQRGLARMAALHVRHVLGREGVLSLYGCVRASNPRWHAGMQRMGYRPVATADLVTLAGRRFLRIVPASSVEAALLEERGIHCGRWMRARE